MTKSIKFYINQIKEIFPNESNIYNELIFFLTEQLGLNHASIFIDEYLLNTSEENAIKDFITKKKDGVPLDYIIQKSSFYKDDFYVDARVLVPRPETEILVDYINNLNLEPRTKILDAGVGSGCIGISIAKYNPDILVFGIDYSFGALEVAKINSNNQKLDNFYLINADWLDCINNKTFNIIVSNPPYIAPSDPHLEKLTHEPSSALIAYENGLKDIKFISNQASKILVDDGLLAFEHGFDQSDSVEKILTESGLTKISLLKDYQSHPRFTIAKK
ncbi:peptide chain release factor N(5)-glutamine methyltransferase [Gammaproteobacteria bacterium]|nr:peptide chain release factor N(5)-glutamine methyltransferase [Gammaproteobacteria bacterium]